MICQIVSSRVNKLLFSTILLSFVAAIIIYVDIVDRWDSFNAGPLYMVAIPVYCVWGGYFARMQKKRCFKIYLTAVIVSLFLIAISHLLGQMVGRSLRLYDVKACVNAGLQDDCNSLLAKWPYRNEVVFNVDPEFGTLPHSVRMFAPVYVINDRTTDTNSIMNIGLCKNGFGGFSIGIRIFRSDKDADKYLADISSTMKIHVDFEFQKMMPGIYYWWQNT